MSLRRGHNPAHPTRRRVLVGLALAAVACAPAQAAHAADKPVDGPGGAPAAAAGAPDRGAAAAHAASPAASKALATMQARIARYVADHGTQYSFASQIDARSGRIVLQSDAPNAVVASITSMADPAERSEVARAKVSRSAIRDAWHRRDDTPAFWGGAGITNGGGICSSGYAVKTWWGATFSVTAGHCFADGANALVESGLRSYGTVSGRRLPTVTGHPMDMELVGGQSYAGRVYTGGVTSTTSRPVYSAGAAFAGYGDYCHSGRTTGENCGHTATSTSAQVCTSSGCKSPVISFTGGTMIQGGDSGGAFYALDSSDRAWIRGNVIATNGTTGWATPYTSVASEYGVSIVTG